VGWQDCIYLVQDREERFVVVTMVINFDVAENARNFESNWGLLASQEGLCLLHGHVTCGCRCLLVLRCVLV
jgi:hypothetical protein